MHGPISFNVFEIFLFALIQFIFEIVLHMNDIISHAILK